MRVRTDILVLIVFVSITIMVYVVGLETGIAIQREQDYSSCIVMGD